MAVPGRFLFETAYCNPRKNANDRSHRRRHAVCSLTMLYTREALDITDLVIETFNKQG